MFCWLIVSCLANLRHWSYQRSNTSLHTVLFVESTVSSISAHYCTFPFWALSPCLKISGGCREPATRTLLLVPAANQRRISERHCSKQPEFYLSETKLLLFLVKVSQFTDYTCLAQSVRGEGLWLWCHLMHLISTQSQMIQIRDKCPSRCGSRSLSTEAVVSLGQ